MYLNVGGVRITNEFNLVEEVIWRKTQVKLEYTMGWTHLKKIVLIVNRTYLFALDFYA